MTHKEVSLIVTKKPRTETAEIDLRRQLEASEARHREAEAKLTLALDAAEMGVWELNLETNAVTGDAKFAALHGVDELPPDAFSFTQKIAHPDDRPEIDKRLRESIENKKPFKYQYRIIRPDGEIRWLSASGILRSEDGEVKTILGVLTDITESKLNEEQSEKKLKKLYSVLMQAPVGICVWEGPEHVYTLANDSYYEIVGKKDLIGLKVRNAFPEVEDLGYFKILDDVYKTGRPFVGKELFASVNLGAGKKKEFYLDSTYQPKFNSEGKIDGIVNVIVDVTSLVSARHNSENLAKDLGEAVKARDEFLSIASHELRTPITSLKLQLQMLRRGVNPADNKVPASERLARTLDLSVNQIDRLTLLVNDLLDVSRIESGKLTYAFAEEDLSSIVKEVLDKFSDLIANTKYSVELNLQPDVIIRCDRFRMEQVITNLLTNSIKYGSNKPIIISVSSGKDKAILTFKDQGMGIDDKLHEKIFQRYERAISSENISGLGLGLYITKQIVQAHNGSIRLTSQLGIGSEFIVELPLLK